MKRRILLKVSSIIPYRNGMLDGVGRSSIELIKKIQEINDPDLEFRLYCTGLKSVFFNFYHWRIKHFSLPFSLRGSSKLSLLLEPLCRRWFVKCDLFHITNNFDEVYKNENFIVTIHDMILYEKKPECRLLFEKVGAKSKMIVTCSAFSKREIIKYLHVPDDKVVVIPWGINHAIFFNRPLMEIVKTLDKYDIKTPYFFSCSCGDKRKNPDITIKAFSDLIQHNANATLVMVWGNCPSEIKNEFRNIIEDGRVKIINGVSNDELACLYSGALASYYISSAEGFGFPMLESFACGTPCVTCANTSLKEIGGTLAFYVKERDVENTKKSMEYFLSQCEYDTQSLVEYSKMFNWQFTAKMYLELYKKVLDISK